MSEFLNVVSICFPLQFCFVFNVTARVEPVCKLIRFTCIHLASHICIINFSVSPPYFFHQSSLTVDLGSLSCEFCILCLSVRLSILKFSYLTLFTVNLVLVVFLTHLTQLPFMLFHCQPDIYIYITSFNVVMMHIVCRHQRN